MDYGNLPFRFWPGNAGHLHRADGLRLLRPRADMFRQTRGVLFHA
jgi:hypothetical protein